MSTQETLTAHALVDRILAAGYTVSIFDGEDWSIRHSTNADRIKAELHATDEEQIVVRTPDRKLVGTIWLVWGNSPEELVADCSDNEEILLLVGGETVP